MRSMKHKGFTLIESLLAMSVILMMALIFLPMMQTLRQMYQHPRISDDLIQIELLRNELALSNQVQVEAQTLYTDAFQYVFDNHRIVKQPGYMIFLQDVDHAYFTSDDQAIYLYYVRDERSYEVLLCETT